MRYLLDTNVYLYWLQNNPQLTHATIETIQHSTVYISTLSLWEITIKIQAKKLKVQGDYFARIQKEAFIELPLTHSHVMELKQLPMIHKDPFDRMLVAQGISEKLPIITSDQTLQKYPVETVLI